MIGGLDPRQYFLEEVIRARTLECNLWNQLWVKAFERVEHHRENVGTKVMERDLTETTDNSNFVASSMC